MISLFYYSGQSAKLSIAVAKVVRTLFEHSGLNGGDVTNWVDASTFSNFQYALPGAIGIVI